jgi:hypothetical protein
MRLLNGVLVVALLAGASARSSAQTVSGRVLEGGSDRPIAAALVSLVANGRSLLRTESDSTGYFRLPIPRPGWYGLRVERLGYAPASTDTLAFGPSESVEIAIRLSVTAVRLGPLLVVERRSSVRPRSEFQRRLESGRRSGDGWFITREALDSTSSPSVTGVLARVPHLGLEHDKYGEAWPVSFSQGGCRPTLYLNGARFQFAEGESIDDIMIPDNLEGIEIFRNRTELPPEFVGIGQCGAIVFWTRGGEPARRGFWRIVAAGGVLLGIVALFVTN